MNEKFKTALPQGYVIRLPTIAEWQYAFQANEKNMKSPYFIPNYANHAYSIYGSIGKKFFNFKDENREWRSNSWGIQDFTKQENVLDLFDHKLITKLNDSKYVSLRRLPELPGRKDPLFWTEDENYFVPVWFLATNSLEATRKGKDYGISHIVIGPDLVGEWKAKQKK